MATPLETKNPLQCTLPNRRQASFLRFRHEKTVLSRVNLCRLHSGWTQSSSCEVSNLIFSFLSLVRWDQTSLWIWSPCDVWFEPWFGSTFDRALVSRHSKPRRVFATFFATHQPPQPNHLLFLVWANVLTISRRPRRTRVAVQLGRRLTITTKEAHCVT